MREINWSEADVQRVMDMRAKGITTEAIAEALGKTPKGIYQMIYRRKRGIVRKRTIYAWSEDDVAELKRLVALGKTTDQIATATGRTAAAVMTKKTMLRAKAARVEPPEAIKWRPIPQHTNLTAMLMGDPVPGRSALDRRSA